MTNFLILKTSGGWAVKRKDGRSFQVPWSNFLVFEVNFPLEAVGEAISFAKKMDTK